MGENHLKIIKAEILQELQVLKDLSKDCVKFYEKNKNNLENSYNLRVLGSILHDFYTCIEKIFRNIAIKIDEEIPSGPSWHSNLLERMNLSIPTIREKVIDADLKNTLYDYMRFRHIFRNVYGFELNWDKMGHLVVSIDNAYKDFKSQIQKFLSFLDQVNIAD